MKEKVDDELIDEIREGLYEQSEGEVDNGLKERLDTEVRRHTLDAKKKKRKMQHLKRDLRKKIKKYKKELKKLRKMVRQLNDAELEEEEYKRENMNNF